MALACADRRWPARSARRSSSILGGAAVVLFMIDGVTPAAVLIETYALSVSPTLPAIPLFTLAGFLLAEGGASARLLRVFRAWFGWIPGGTAVVCAVLCSFFTVFTGGSGVTILALGGAAVPGAGEGRLPRALFARPADRLRIARPAAAAGAAADPLRRRRADPDRGPVHRRHSARHPADDDDRGVGRARGDRRRTRGRQPFACGEARARRSGTRSGSWRCRSSCSASCSAASRRRSRPRRSTALYALVVQTIVHRDISFARDLLRVLAECAAVVGGVLVILGVAVGSDQLSGRARRCRRGCWRGRSAHRLAVDVPARR